MVQLPVASARKFHRRAPQAGDRAALTVAELFAGIGGVTSGFLRAGGFAPVFLHDADRAARDTFKHNCPQLGHAYHLGDICQLTGPDVRSAAGGEIDGLLGCPPCQGFSSAGTRDSDDARNGLLDHFRRLVWSLGPKFFVMENVPGMLTSERYEKFAEVLGRRYRLHAEVVNAAEYGLPQLRRRAVVVGLHKDVGAPPSLPAPTHGGRGRVYDYYSGEYVSPATRRGRNRLKLRPDISPPPRSLVTVREALEDLASELTPGEEESSYTGPPATPYQRRVRNGSKQVRHHQAINHTAATVRKLARVEPGDCPETHGDRSRNQRYFSQAYSRLHPDGLARTVTTNFHNPGSGRFTHYSAPRALTEREALRLQGFPDDFVFESGLARKERKRLIGNAFPPPLAEALASHVRDLVRK